ncbi:glycosyltransferase [Microcoleus sp. FACHB-672]|uniref:glycosyltransferase n=1 Tax=Microcoleus sp. FACHB-672 TaxID=2692825 RepID=UPI00168A289A|nr:glycosyltransferase [Microcoleus sp. FACHB-672]MBD2039814.1 glycosyltransferase [Microcoleus sp. FACHB-672]
MQEPTALNSPPPASQQKIQFTGIAVTYNEARRLRDCLNSLRFCEQLIVVDLGSTDASVEIAQQCGAEVVHHERVPIVEHIREKAVTYARNDWVIFLDPDEVLPAKVEDELRWLITQQPNLGLINLPRQFYFKNNPLNFTIWGKEQLKQAVLHKHRSKFSVYVHQPVQIINGYISTTLPRQPNYYLKHYWVDSYRQMFEKHWRYIKLEGKSRYERGERFYWHSWFKSIGSALIHNLFTYNGIRGGLLGIFLSFFYAWYVAMSVLSLRQYQKSREKEIGSN